MFNQNEGTSMQKSKSIEQTNVPSQLLAETFLDYAGALVLILDKSGRIIQFNRACEKLSGLSFSEVKGKFPWDTILPPEDAETIRKNAFEILANKPESMSGSYTNYWLIKNDGRALIDWINTVVLDESGRMKNIVSVGMDVTETRHNEEMLKKSEVRLKEAQRIAKVGSWELDILNNELFWTDEIFNIFEIDQSEFEASYDAFINGIHPDDRKMVNQAYTESLNNRTPYEIVHRLKMTDGRVKYVRETCESFFDDDGKPLRSVGTVQDITELHNAEEELIKYRDHLEEVVVERTADMEQARDDAERANNAKSEFLSRMSHELRTPLNAILGFGQLFEMDLDELSQKQKGNITEILDAGSHLLSLVNDVLDLSTIESGKLEITMEAVPVDAVLKECIALINIQAKERQLNIVDHVSSMGHIVYADFTRLKQVLLNLLSNAVKYNSNSGSITLSSKVINNHFLRICIADTGNGLSKNSLSKLFTPFERLDVNGVDGVGIGLVISKYLTEMMGGSIGVDSEQGKGSVFWIEIELFNVT